MFYCDANVHRSHVRLINIRDGQCQRVAIKFISARRSEMLDVFHWSPAGDVYGASRQRR